MTANEVRAAPQWSSGLSFFFAASGMAIGLGNIWRFPFLAGQYGGGAFVLVYLAAVAFIGVPIIAAELVIGRRGGGTADHSIRVLSEDAKTWPIWRLIGWLSVFIPFVGIAYYSVVAGWVVDYSAHFIASGGLAGSAEVQQARYDGMLASPVRVVAAHSIFMALVAVVAAFGVRNGLEPAAKILMPILFLLMIGLAVYASLTGAFAEAVDFLFRFEFSELTRAGVAAAIGQAFFSLGIAFGAMIAFGAYLPRRVSILSVASAVAAADTAAALAAGLAIFPIVFALGIDPAAGPGLVFVTMPAAFAAMPAGLGVGAAFFILVSVAAFTTGVATVEPVIAWLQAKGLGRVPATIATAACAWAVGLAAAFSFNIWSDIRPLAVIPAFADKSIFDVLDFAIANVLLPFNGLLIALFVGWALAARLTRAELAAPGVVHALWRTLLRMAAPVAIVFALWL
jgi:NSS family neurotransmitter:Na+ symporter